MKPDFCNLHASDLTSSSGFANEGENSTIHLHVHSNCFYDLRRKSGTVKTRAMPTFEIDEDYRAKVQEFADKVDAQTAMRLIVEGYGAKIESNGLTVRVGNKYAR